VCTGNAGVELLLHISTMVGTDVHSAVPSACRIQDWDRKGKRDNVVWQNREAVFFEESP